MVTYHENYLPLACADFYLEHLLESKLWQTDAPVIYGKPRPCLRQTLSFGDPGISYSYSGMVKKPIPWTKPMTCLKHQLAADGVDSNFCLANLYPNGKAGIGVHADDEPDLDPHAPIVTVSLGSERTFVLQDHGGKKVKAPLKHGSALVMWLDTQKHWKHSIPKALKVTQPRVSLTFRTILPQKVHF